MRLIIAGSRDMKPFVHGLTCLVLGLFPELRRDGDHEIVCGMAPGVDTAGREFAESAGFRVAEFPAEWKLHGKPAGPIRNREMAQYADSLLLIWNGESKGSASMLAEAKRAGLRIIQVVL